MFFQRYWLGLAIGGIYVPGTARCLAGRRMKAGGKGGDSPLFGGSHSWWLGSGNWGESVVKRGMRVMLADGSSVLGERGEVARRKMTEISGLS